MHIIYTRMYIHTHTHTHTHIYIYIYVCVCAPQRTVTGERAPRDPPLLWLCS